MSEGWICRELRDTDRPSIRQLCDASDPNALLYVRDAAAAGLWWYGAVGRNGTSLGAALQVEGTTATLLAADGQAAAALGQGLLQHQRMIGRDHGDRHVVRGPAAVMGQFWEAFRHNGRKVVADRTATLYRAAPAGPSRLEVRSGDATDLKLFSEFLADAILETRGFDPRRTGREAHERRCAQLLRDGSGVVARDGGLAVLVGELTPLGPQVAMLDPWLVPRAMRARKRLVAQALAPLPGLAPAAGRQLVAFAEGAELGEAMALAGWQAALSYRTIEMQG